MNHIENFEFFENRKERKSKETEIDLKDYSKNNRCQSKCSSKVLHTEEGPKVICTECKRIIREMNW